jgi:hypothetical protein
MAGQHAAEPVGIAEGQPPSPPAGAGPAYAPAGPPRPPETAEVTYARQTRNATVFVAVCVGVFTVLALIGLIIVGAQAASIKNQLEQINNNGGTATSNCESQGGTNPSC